MEPPAKKVKRESVKKHTDTSDLDNQVWLIKIPASVARRWKAAKPGDHLGEISVPADAPVEMNLVGTASALASNNYEFKFQNGYPPAYVLTETANGPSLIGTVSEKGDVVARRTQTYSRELKARTKQSDKKERKTIALGDFDGNIGGVFVDDGLTGKQRKEKKEMNKRVRDDKEVVTDMLMRLYTEQRYWSIAALAHRTDQPEGWVKEILAPMTRTFKAGPYKGKYELLPAFAPKKWPEEEEDATADADAAE